MESAGRVRARPKREMENIVAGQGCEGPTWQCMRMRDMRFLFFRV